MRDVDDRVGKVLRRLLVLRGMRKKDIIVRTGISRATVDRHFDGSIFPKLEDRELYAEAFGFPPAEFEEMWQMDSESPYQCVGWLQGFMERSDAEEVLKLLPDDFLISFTQAMEREMSNRGLPVPSFELLENRLMLARQLDAIADLSSKDWDDLAHILQEERIRRLGKFFTYEADRIARKRVGVTALEAHSPPKNTPLDNKSKGVDGAA